MIGQQERICVNCEVSIVALFPNCDLRGLTGSHRITSPPRMPLFPDECGLRSWSYWQLSERFRTIEK
jgi:hypothetical protein